VRRALPVPVVGACATLVGERTYGKGLVQVLQQLPNAGARRLTTAHVARAGSAGTGVGVAPDLLYAAEPTPGAAVLNRPVEVVTSR
jgi:C-terminal processing protease CtpA/Prc